MAKTILNRRSAIIGSGVAGTALMLSKASAQSPRQRVSPQPHFAEVAAAAAAEGQPARSLEALDKALAATIGHKIFTVLMVNLDKGENQRYYTNQPTSYPTGGAKPIVKTNDFYRQIIVAGQPRICYNYEDMKRAFFDHELIHSLGCESAVNVPIRWSGKTVGSLNLCHEAGWYSSDDLPTLSVFAEMAIPALLEIINQNKA